MARYAYLAALVTFPLFLLNCENDDPESEDPDIENIGTLISQSASFSQFANLISIADQEIPDGEQSVMEMLNDPGNELTVFAPSDATFERLAQEWSSPNFQASVSDVIAEFTHSGQPAKTRDFVLGHIFKSQTRYESSQFQNDLIFESQSGIRWRMIATDNASSGYGLSLAAGSGNNPYLIYQTDLIQGGNGVVHEALVN